MDMRLRRISHRAFTLVEVLISLVVIGILSGTMMMTMGSGSDKARAIRIAGDMKTISRAAGMAFADGVVLTPDVTILNSYLSGRLTGDGKYALHLQDGHLYVKADLSDNGGGVRSRLSRMAGQWNLWQEIGGDNPGVYSDAVAVFLPVSLRASDGGTGTESLLTLHFDSKEDMGQLVRIDGGTWTVVDGVLRDTGSGNYFLGEPSWKDYTVTADVALGESAKGYGLYYRTTINESGKLDGYRFQFDPGLHPDQFVVRNVTGTYHEPFLKIDGKDAKVNMSEVFPEGINLNADHTVQISVNGDHHVITVDGRKVFDFHDSTYDAGGSGFRTWGGGATPTEFRDVSIEQN